MPTLVLSTNCLVHQNLGRNGPGIGLTSQDTPTPKDMFFKSLENIPTLMDIGTG